MALSFGLNGAVTQTAFANIHDLTPNYAASVLSIANFFGGTSGFVTPLVVTYFTKDNVSAVDRSCVVSNRSNMLGVLAEHVRGLAERLRAGCDHLHCTGAGVHMPGQCRHSAVEQLYGG